MFVNENTIWIRDYSNGKLIKSMTDHTASIECLEISKNNSRIVTGSLDKKVIFYNYIIIYQIY